MLTCPLCHTIFDQSNHLPVVGVLFRFQTTCLTCWKKQPPIEKDLYEGYVVNYTIKEIMETYEQEKAPVVELMKRLEERRREQSELEEELRQILEKKEAIAEDISRLQEMRKGEEPGCTEWEPCNSCLILTNSQKLLNCLSCADLRNPKVFRYPIIAVFPFQAICATCIQDHHKHLQDQLERGTTQQRLDETIELDMSNMSVCEEKPTNMLDSAICLDSDSVIVLD